MSRRTWQALGFAVVLGSTGSAQVTQRVSIGRNGIQGNGDSGIRSMNAGSISADGRYVVFSSIANNLVLGDTNNDGDVFVRDRQLGTVERVSVANGGVQAEGLSEFPSISADGRFVAFSSGARNLVNGDSNSASDVFVHDRRTGATERISIATNGEQGNGDCGLSSLSADGRYAAFSSLASNLVPGDTGGWEDIFVRDRLTGTTERVSVATNGMQANRHSYAPFISADGRYVAFASLATNLVPGDTNGAADVFVHDRQSGTTERVSVSSSGTEGNRDSGINGGLPSGISMSANGRFVAFASAATNLVPGFASGTVIVCVHDRQSGAIECVSVDSSGAAGNADSGLPSISADGRFVAFNSWSTNLVVGDTNSVLDVFIHDRRDGATRRMSIATDGTQGDNLSFAPSLSSDGRFVAFGSFATNLVTGDTNATGDSFVHDPEAASFSSLCEPGVGGVIACPCSNPPAGPVHGCDNSAASGGASLTASGIAYLSIDSLVFTTSGEPPTAFSIVMQGNTLLTNGVVYGQGVRCVGGATKRLYTKTAVAGSITAPDLGAGDPTVSARSAAKGDVIQPGQSRWYLVYYRDPIVLGGCPASSTFNATQTGRVDWSF